MSDPNVIVCDEDDVPELPTHDESGTPYLYISDADHVRMWEMLKAAERGADALAEHLETHYCTKEEFETLLRVNACFMRYASRVSVELDTAIDAGAVAPVDDEAYVGFVGHLMTLGRDLIAELIVEKMAALNDPERRKTFFTKKGKVRQNDIRWVQIVPMFIDRLAEKHGITK